MQRSTDVEFPRTGLLLHLQDHFLILIWFWVAVVVSVQRQYGSLVDLCKGPLTDTLLHVVKLCICLQSGTNYIITHFLLVLYSGWLKHGRVGRTYIV